MDDEVPKYQTGDLLVKKIPRDNFYSTPLFVLILGMGEVDIDPLRTYQRYVVFWLDENMVEHIDVEYIDRLYVLAT